MLLFRLVNGILGSFNNDGELFNWRSKYFTFLGFIFWYLTLFIDTQNAFRYLLVWALRMIETLIQAIAKLKWSWSTFTTCNEHQYNNNSHCSLLWNITSKQLLELPRSWIIHYLLFSIFVSSTREHGWESARHEEEATSWNLCPSILIV